MSNLQIDSARVARVFKALSNPHRLTIFLKLASCLGVESSLDTSDEGIQQCQLEQARTLGLAPSTVSSHYKELRDSGLIRMERQGKSVRFWIDPQTLDLARSVLGPFAPRAEHPDTDKE
ncbi:MAG: ArsR/SmtB family transcription factor [Acidobacteriota bacterium]